MKVGPIEEVEDFSLPFKLQLLSQEPWEGKEFLKGEVDVVVSRRIVSVSTEVAFNSQSRGRETCDSGCLDRAENPVQVVFLFLSCQVPAKRRSVWNIPVRCVGVVVAPVVACDNTAGNENLVGVEAITRRQVSYRWVGAAYWRKSAGVVDREGQAGLQHPNTAELPAAENVSRQQRVIGARYNPRSICRETFS